MARSASRLFRFAVEHSLVLPAGAVIALVWANRSAASYVRFAHALEFAVNDIGMAFFFGLAAKEVVEATAPGGGLHPWRRAALPIGAAVGGMAGPALIYIGLTRVFGSPELTRGWAIPCATDIAFSYLVAKAIFGREREHPAIPFLLLLAIADDAFGLIILAVFYPVGELHLPVGSALMAAALGAALALRWTRARTFWPYLIVGGTLSWAGLFWGGLHPALALVPIVPFMPHAARDPGWFVEVGPGARDPLSEFEHEWKHPVQVVLFLFGLVNAGVPLEQVGFATWAVLGAILVGKPLGILASVGIGLAAGLRLPRRLQWPDVITVGFAAAIGFTVALFFATAAFPPGPALDQAKMGALLSVLSGAVTFAVAWLLRVGRFASSHAATARSPQ